VRSGCDYQPRGGRELGLKDRANSGEPLLSRRDRQHAKEADRHEPKGKQSGRGSVLFPRADDALPAGRRSLRPSGLVRVWNVVSPTVPTGRVDSHPQGCAHGRVGKGCRKKRMPICNGSDRGSSFALPRKGADFRWVLDHEKGAERCNLDGFLDDECHWRH
jgi:hypothetical protein